MKNTKKNEISKNNKYLKHSFKNENMIEKSTSEEKPLSLKYQHFEIFSKKNSDISKINKLRQQNLLNERENKRYIQNNKFLINFTQIKSVLNSQNKDIKISKDRYNNLNTYSNTEKDINIINSLNKSSFKKNINLIKNKDKRISLKNKILNEENTKDEKDNLQNIIQINKKIFDLKSKTLNKTFLIKSNSNKTNNKIINVEKSRNKANLFLRNHHSQNSEGYLGRKELNGVPFTFEPIMVHNNIYSNKSEKKRHEIILEEFTKLRQYIERQPEKKLIFIKEFLNKYYIKYEEYSKNQLSSLCDFICYHDNNAISSILKPYLDIKNMIVELLNNIYIVNNLLGIKQSMKNNEIKEAIISEETNSNNDSKFYENLSRYSSPNLIENSDGINTENTKIKFYTKENFRKQKYENSLTDNEEILKEIKIKLYDLEHQKRLHYPDKNYPFRNDLIIKDMKKEMDALKNNFEQTYMNNKSFSIKKILKTQNNFNNSNDKISSKIKNAITFSEFNKKPKNIRGIEEEIYNKFIISNRTNKNNLPRFMLMKKDDSYINKNNISNIKNINKYSMDEIIKRLYYKPMKIGFDINEIRKNNKITEYYALKLAKHNQFLIDINNNNYFKNKNIENKPSQQYILKDI